MEPHVVQCSMESFVHKDYRSQVICRLNTDKVISVISAVTVIITNKYFAATVRLLQLHRMKQKPRQMSAQCKKSIFDRPTNSHYWLSELIYC